MKRVLATGISLILLSSFDGLAQKEANIWYFGYQAGLDFSSGSPVVINNSAMNTAEGSASICDENGNLMFYTNGWEVYNRNHVFMANGTGLMGHFSTTQSALIVPNPVNKNIYYIFTADYQGNPNGLRYSIVDMTMAGGLGAVTSKNNLLASPVVEKITAARHQNHVDFWVVAHGWNNNFFYAYKVTSTGVSTTPVVSITGEVHGGPFTSAAIGCVRISADGSKIAVAMRDTLLQVFDFNRATGIVSNPISLHPPGMDYHYGVEFNIAGNLVYVSTLSNQHIYQYDLNAGTQADIQASQQLVGISSAPSVGTLQMGPDGRIYVARYFTQEVGVIQFPDIYGPGCGYTDQAINLNGATCYLGLPNFYNSIFYTPNIISSLYCLGDSTAFILDNRKDVDSVHWDFDDPLSADDNRSTLYEPRHLFTDTGTFYVKATIFCGPYNDTLLHEIVITGPPEVNLGSDTVLCTGASLLLDATSDATSYLWHNGSNAPTFTATAGGLYWVEASNSCGSARDTIIITDLTAPIVDLGNDTIVCAGDFVSLDATFPGANYSWSNGASDSVISVTLPGMYYVAVQNQCGTTVDSVMISNMTEPQFSLGPDTGLCSGQSILLNATYPNASYLWSTGSTASTLLVSTAATYWVRVANVCGATYDTIVVQPQSKPSVNLGNDTTICQGDVLLLNAFYPGATYTWHDNTTGSVKGASLPGVYWVDVTNSCGTVRDSLQLQNLAAPSVSLGNDTTLCTGDSLLLWAFYQGASYLWNNGSTLPGQIAHPPGTYNVEVSNTCGTDYDTLQVFELQAPAVSLGNDTAICAGDQLVLDASFNASSYQWSTGSSASSILATSSGSYSVTVTNMCGIATDAIQLTVVDYPTVDLGNDTLICDGTSILLNATFPGANYLWHDASVGPTYSASSPGTYSVAVSNMCGTASDDVDVGILPLPVVDLGPDTAVCAGESADLFAVGQHVSTYLWDNGSTLPNRSVVQPGTYSVIVANACGTHEDSVAVLHHPLPQVDLGEDVELCWGETLTLDAAPFGLSFVWSDASTAPTFLVSSAGAYSVTVTDQYGCRGDDVIVVDYECTAIVEVPTAFCPSCNPPNNAFQVFGDANGSFEVMVFSRWGEKVFESKDFGFKWDGTYGGQPLPLGSYMFMIRYEDFDKSIRRIHGNVTLLR